MNTRRLLVAFTLALCWPSIGRQIAAARAQRVAPPSGPAHLPNKTASLKWAAFGDFGTGAAAEYQTAAPLTS